MRRGNQYRSLASLIVVAYLLVALAIAAMFAFSRPAAAHDYPCMLKPLMWAMLTDRFSESRSFAMGLGDKNAAEVWTNAENGSWTLIGITPDGFACHIASGDGWEDAPPIPAPAREG